MITLQHTLTTRPSSTSPLSTGPLSKGRRLARVTLGLTMILAIGLVGAITPTGETIPLAMATEPSGEEAPATDMNAGEQTEQIDAPPPAGDAPPPMPDAPPPAGPAQPPVGDAPPPPTDTPPPASDAPTPVGDEPPPASDSPPPTGEGGEQVSEDPPPIMPFNEPPPPLTGERTFIRVASSLRQGLTIGIRKSSASGRDIYQNGERIDSLAAGTTSNFSWTEESVDHPGLYLHKSSDNQGTVGEYRQYLECVNPDQQFEGFDPRCTMPEPFKVTISWTITGKLQSCIDLSNDHECPDTTVHMTEIYQFYPRPPSEDDEHDPVAMFTATQSVSDPYEFSFNNTSSDQDSDFSSLQFSWDFGDGETSTEVHPTHRYANGGEYTVKLVVADPTSRAASYERNIEVSNGLIVNSTGDAPASDPGTLGCDTGGTIGDDAVPECTLRAAIETVNEEGSGEITFGIDGEPLISLGSPLPTVLGMTSIDGSTQPGGWVEIVGGDKATLTLGQGTVIVKGLALHGAKGGIQVSAGAGHVIEGNRIGVNLAEAPTADTQTGVTLASGDIAAVRNNVIGVSNVGIGNFSEGSIGEITGNSIGVTAAGQVLSDLKQGISLLGSAPSLIENNLIRATHFGVMVVGVQTSGTSISSNRVGTTGTAAFAGVGTGIVVEAATDVSVSGNTVVAGDWGGILIAGSVQVTFDDDDVVTFLPPTGYVLETPVSSTRVAITNNTVATAGGSRGIGSWADASELTITGNTISESGESGGVSLTGGKDHLIAGNVLGSSGAYLAGSGVWLTNTSSSKVTSNTIFAREYGIHFNGDGAGATINQNAVNGNDNRSAAGIFVENGREGVTVTENTVADSGAVGIEIDGPNAQITDNTVIGAGNGIIGKGEKLVIKDNRVGVASGSTAVIGNRDNGISILSGDGTVRGNTIAGSGSSGIYVAPDSTATLRANRIWQSGDDAITATNAAPEITATLITDTESTRLTTLMITGIPTGESGKIEVFSNDSCEAADAQAKYVMGITRDTKAGQGMKLIQFESKRDHFTITYTTKEGVTSRLSNCESRTVYPDADNDGSPDPIDDLVGAKDNPMTAALVTTNEQLLVVSTDTGILENVRVMDDPADKHPAGWVLPYGVLGFNVGGLDLGGTAQVTLTAIYSDGPIQGNSYWKYGPATSGAAPSWYAFDSDSGSGTGAEMTSVEVDEIGLRRAFVLTLVDGARGDSDMFENGYIVDPGGPVISDESGANTGEEYTPVEVFVPESFPEVSDSLTNKESQARALAVSGGEARDIRIGALFGTGALLAGAALILWGRMRSRTSRFP